MPVHRMHLSPIENSSRSERVHDLLKEQILERKLLPGDKLDIYALAAILKVSRSTIKEAINRLSGEGLITIYPQRGTFVRNPMSPKEVEELFGVRLMVELWGLDAVFNDLNLPDLNRMEDLLLKFDSLFASTDTFDYMTFFRYDHAFHTLIVNAAGNSRLNEMYESLAVHILILRTYWGQPRDRALKSHEDHHLIFDSLCGKNPEVRRILVQHIERSRDLTLALGSSGTTPNGSSPTESSLTVPAHS